MAAAVNNLTLVNESTTATPTPRRRDAHGLHISQYRESLLIRSAAEAIGKPIGWSARYGTPVCGSAVRPLSPGDSQAAPTIDKAINGVDGIFISDFERGEIGPELFRHACLMGLEGLVSIG